MLAQATVPVLLCHITPTTGLFAPAVAVAVVVRIEVVPADLDVLGTLRTLNDLPTRLAYRVLCGLLKASLC